MLVAADGILAVGTKSFSDIKGEIIVTDSTPIINEVEWDHIVEGSIEIRSGLLKISNCPDWEMVLKVNIAPGTYRIRLSGKNFNSVIDDDGDDFYKIGIWPQAHSAVELIKLYSIR